MPGPLSDSVSQFATRQQTVIKHMASKGQVAKKARWEIRGNAYLRNYGGMSRGALIQVDPTLNANVAELIETSAPALARAINRHLVPVAERAFDKWPVQSGLSKSLLALEFGIAGANGSEFTSRIVNRAPYAWFIQSPGPIVRELIFLPGEDAAKRIAAEVVKEIG